MKYVFDALIHKMFFLSIKLNNFRVDLTDISAKEEALASSNFSTQANTCRIEECSTSYFLTFGSCSFLCR